MLSCCVSIANTQIYFLVLGAFFEFPSCVFFFFISSIQAQLPCAIVQNEKKNRQESKQCFISIGILGVRLTLIEHAKERLTCTENPMAENLSYRNSIPTINNIPNERKK